jgi:PBP1b-binding outer membrane lipoprotein LpoB
MKKTLLLTIILGLGLFITGCEEKTTEEKLKENTEKQVDLIKESISETASDVEDAFKK